VVAVSLVIFGALGCTVAASVGALGTFDPGCSVSASIRFGASRVGIAGGGCALGSTATFLFEQAIPVTLQRSPSLTHPAPLIEQSSPYDAHPAPLRTLKFPYALHAAPLSTLWWPYTVARTPLSTL
jgi:hypothetical protein